MSHVFLGDIDAWMYSDLAGINCDPLVPGFRHIVFRPHFVEGLDGVSASCRTASGTVASSWKRHRGKVKLEVSVPSGTTATLHAGGRTEELASGRHFFTFDN